MKEKKFGSLSDMLKEQEEADKKEALARDRGETLFVGSGQAVHARPTGNSSFFSNPLEAMQRMMGSVHRVPPVAIQTADTAHTIRLWRNGWQVGNSTQLRPYDDPLLEEIMEGRAPASLLGIDPGAQVDVSIDTSRIGEDFSPSRDNTGIRLGRYAPIDDDDISAQAPIAESTSTPTVKTQSPDPLPADDIENIGQGDGSLAIIDTDGKREIVKFQAEKATIAELRRYLQQKFGVSDLVQRGTRLHLSKMDQDALLRDTIANTTLVVP